MASRRDFLRRLAAGSLPLLTAACNRRVDDPRTLTVWHTKSATERGLLEQAARTWEASHPGHRVALLQKGPEELRNIFILASVAGRGPDLVYGATDNVGVFTLTETIRPLDDVLETEDFAAQEPAGIVSAHGQRWLTADQRGDHLVLVHDPARIPTPPATLAEWIELARAHTDAAKSRYGLAWVYGEPFFIVPLLTSFGGWLLEGERPTLDTPAMVETVRFLLRLRSEQLLPRESDYNLADGLFKDGSAAMIVNGPWAWADYGVPERNRIAPLPRNELTGRWCGPIVMAKGYCVNRNVSEARLPLVRDLLLHLTGAPLQLQMAHTLRTRPTNLAALADPFVLTDPTLLASHAAMSHGVPMPVEPQLRQVWDGMRGPLQQVAAGRLDPADGARAMQRETEKLIRDSML